MDIGQYDGGFEREDEGLGSAPAHLDEEAAAILALDSSMSRKAPTKQWKLSSFELGRPLGKGKFGRVYMVRTIEEPKYIIALKCLHKIEIVQAKVEKQVRREIEIQSNLRYAFDATTSRFYHPGAGCSQRLGMLQMVRSLLGGGTS